MSRDDSSLPKSLADGDTAYVGQSIATICETLSAAGISGHHRVRPFFKDASGNYFLGEPFEMDLLTGEVSLDDEGGVRHDW